MGKQLAISVQEKCRYIGKVIRTAAIKLA